MQCRVQFPPRSQTNNHLGQPLACVSSAPEVVTEDHRLEALGYQLTDKGRVLPEHLFTWKPQEEE